jgi:hypothetical protein
MTSHLISPHRTLFANEDYSILRGTPFHPAQIVEPYISTDDHVQVAVPRVLRLVRAKSLPGLEVHIPRARHQRFVLVTVINDVRRREQSFEYSPRK